MTFVWIYIDRYFDYILFPNIDIYFRKRQFVPRVLFFKESDCKIRVKPAMHNHFKSRMVIIAVSKIA